LSQSPTGELFGELYRELLKRQTTGFLTSSLAQGTKDICSLVPLAWDQFKDAVAHVCITVRFS